MSGDFLADRKRGVEEAFFARESERLRAELLANATDGADGIADPAVRSDLAGRGLGNDTAAAVALMPLVAVAWADGDVSAKERTALLAAATDAGIRPGTPSHRLFEGWLNRKPGPDLLDTWKGYVGALAADMEPPARLAFRRDISGRARTVAEAAGGLLGFGQVSSAEQAVLDDIDRAFGV